MEPATKKTKINPMAYSFTVTQPKTWETLVEIVQPILQDCHFRVVDNDEFSGISMESIDSKSVCVVIAKLKGKVEIVDDTKTNTSQEFCVPVDLLLAHLKSVNPTNVINVHSDAGGAELKFDITSSVSGKKVRHFELSTLNRDFQEIDFNAIDYQYTVDFNLHELRKVLRLASGRSVDCPEIRLRILEEIDQAGKYSSFFLIHISSEQSYGEYCYQSQIDMDDGKTCKSLTITNSNFDVDEDTTKNPPPTMSQLKETFNEVFSVTYLHNFIKSLDGNNVVIKLSPGKPLVLTNILGDETSYVSFVLAHRRQDTVVDKITSFVDDR